MLLKIPVTLFVFPCRAALWDWVNTPVSNVPADVVCVSVQSGVEGVSGVEWGGVGVPSVDSLMA